jgi:predicted glycoside hydrolase/deacetylase ChbG (UPF0249 family)
MNIVGLFANMELLEQVGYTEIPGTYDEFIACCDKLKAAGIIPTHIDSHEHTHTLIALQDVLCKVMDKHRIKRVRRKMIPSIRLILKRRKHPDSVRLDKKKAVTPKRQNVLYRRLRVFIVKYQSVRWNRQMSKRYMMTDSFFAFRVFCSIRNNTHSGKVIELMCHPGHTSYQAETDSLIKEPCWHQNINIISYKDL